MGRRWAYFLLFCALVLVSDMFAVLARRVSVEQHAEAAAGRSSDRSEPDTRKVDVPHPDQLESYPEDLDERIRKFERWLEQRNVDTSNIRVVRQYGWLGLEARRPIKRGEVIMSVPPTLALRRDTALANPVVGPLVRSFYTQIDAPPRVVEPLEGWFAALILLHFEAFFNPQSDWAPYLQLLPTRFRTHFSLTTAEKAVLRMGEYFAPEFDLIDKMEDNFWVILREKLFKRHPEVYGNTSDPEVLHSLRVQTRWLHATMSARLFSPQFEGDSTAFVPLMGMANHHPDARPLSYSRWTPAPEDRARIQREDDSVPLPLYHAVAERDIAPGEPVFVAYDVAGARKCAMDFLMHYGFVPHDAANGCFPITLTVPPYDQIVEPEKAIMHWALTREGMITRETAFNDTNIKTVVKGDGTLPSATMKALRLSNLAPTEMHLFEEALHDAVVSTRNELRSLRALRDVLQSALDRHDAFRRKAEELGILSKDEHEWTPSMHEVMRVHELGREALRVTMDTAGRHWAGLLNSSYEDP